VLISLSDLSLSNCHANSYKRWILKLFIIGFAHFMHNMVQYNIDKTKCWAEKGATVSGNAANHPKSEK